MGRRSSCYLLGMEVLYVLLLASCGYAFQPSNRHEQNLYRDQSSSFSQLSSKFRGSDIIASRLEHLYQDEILSNRQYLSNGLGFSEEKLNKISCVTYDCSILTLEHGVLEERVDQLNKRLKLKEVDIKRIIQKHPDILGMQSDHVKDKMDELQQHLFLDEKELAKMIIRWPDIMTYSIEENIKPTLNWVQYRLGLTDTELSKMIKRHPQILGCSIPDNMEPTLDWLQSRHGLDEAALSKMIQSMPHILGYSISDNMERKLNWLQQNLCLTDKELSKMMQQHPPLFGYNIDTNLEPTLDFYIDALGDKSEALALVTRNPVAFGVSLEKRLKPRLKEAQNAGMSIDTKLMNLIMKYTPMKWAKKVAKSSSPSQVTITNTENQTVVSK